MRWLAAVVKYDFGLKLGFDYALYLAFSGYLSFRYQALRQLNLAII
jgi:hypothetical protein